MLVVLLEIIILEITNLITFVKTPVKALSNKSIEIIEKLLVRYLRITLCDLTFKNETGKIKDALPFSDNKLIDLYINIEKISLEPRRSTYLEQLQLFFEAPQGGLVAMTSIFDNKWLLSQKTSPFAKLLRASKQKILGVLSTKGNFNNTLIIQS